MTRPRHPLSDPPPLGRVARMLIVVGIACLIYSCTAMMFALEPCGSDASCAKLHGGTGEPSND